MLYFPSLAVGAAVQYPVVKRTAHPVLETKSPGGHVQRGLTEWSSTVEWDLEYRELSDAEAGAIEDLYAATDGGLRSFTFCDPLANLLRWSEDFSKSVWQLTGVGVVGQRLTNVSGATAPVTQSVELPAGSRCTFSCEMRGAAGTQVTLRAGSVAKRVGLSGDWRPYSVTAETEGTTAFGIELQSGSSVEMRAPQAELQASPSPYKPSFDRAGVSQETTFVEGSLRIMATGPNRNAARVRLRSKVGSGA